MSIGNLLNAPVAIAMAEAARVATPLDTIVRCGCDALANYGADDSTQGVIDEARAELAALRTTHALVLRLGEVLQAHEDVPTNGDALLRARYELDAHALGLVAK